MQQQPAQLAAGVQQQPAQLAAGVQQQPAQLAAGVQQQSAQLATGGRCQRSCSPQRRPGLLPMHRTAPPPPGAHLDHRHDGLVGRVQPVRVLHQKAGADQAAVQALDVDLAQLRARAVLRQRVVALTLDLRAGGRAGGRAAGGSGGAAWAGWAGRRAAAPTAPRLRLPTCALRLPLKTSCRWLALQRPSSAATSSTMARASGVTSRVSRPLTSTALQGAEEDGRAGVPASCGHQRGQEMTRMRERRSTGPGAAGSRSRLQGLGSASGPAARPPAYLHTSQVPLQSAALNFSPKWASRMVRRHSSCASAYAICGCRGGAA